MLKKNDGLTFIEVMVVVAILGVMATFVGSMIYNNADWKIEKAATKITECLSETHTNALAKTSSWLQIKYDNGKYILSTSYNKDEELGSDRDFQISFTAKEKNGNTENVYYLSSFEGLVISYNRSDGSFAEVCSRIEVEQNDDGKEVYTPKAAAGLTGRVCTDITIWQGSEVRGVITLYPETGKYKLKLN